MRRFLVSLALLCAGAVWLAGQAPISYLIPLWTGKAYTWVRPGPTLAITNGELNALPAPVKVRRYGVPAIYDATVTGWRVPANIASVVVHVNGLRYSAGVDYDISGGIMRAKSDSMLPEHSVILDYDE